MHKYLLLFFFILFCQANALAQQHYTSLKFFGLSLHPYGDENAHLMPLNPDERGYFVLNVGATLGHEISLIENRLTFKVLQALYADCAAQAGGFSHVGLRATIFKLNKHQLTGGRALPLSTAAAGIACPTICPAIFSKAPPPMNGSTGCSGMAESWNIITS